MDNSIVVGIGNIYATESLFLAGINPMSATKFLSRKCISKLVKAIKEVISQAIRQGGTTLKDFTNSEGKPGYFVNKLKVYGRSGLPCLVCHAPLQMIRIGNRSTVYCQYCQP
jgi:formamidopyrimidine-DNA glycosylase